MWNRWSLMSGSVLWMLLASGLGSAIGAERVTSVELRVAQADTETKGGVPKKDEKVKAEAHLSVDKLAPGQECKILIRLTVAPGWHINANPAKPEGFPATEVSFKGKKGTLLKDVKFPPGKSIQMPDQDEPVSVYFGKVDVFGKLVVPAEAAGMTEEMEIVVTYQACDENRCLPPTTVKLGGKLPVAQSGESVRSINEKLFKPSGT
ncbi:MAG: hypothetical protein B7Z55_05175 [Planctomycetales bacterium 12-60-4]|nr:MAG: hypothetical protein B7Z55_05175 [Planctomycetales bacterium 12-60-4]